MTETRPPLRPDVSRRVRSYLRVDVRPVVHQELQAERSVRGGGGEVQRREALVVGLPDVGAVVDQLADDGVLAVVAGHVERRVPERVALVDLLPG